MNKTAISALLLATGLLAGCTPSAQDLPSTPIPPTSPTTSAPAEVVTQEDPAEEVDLVTSTPEAAGPASMDDLNDFVFGRFTHCLDVAQERQGHTDETDVAECEKVARNLQANGVHDVDSYNAYLQHLSAEAVKAQTTN